VGALWAIGPALAEGERTLEGAQDAKGLKAVRIDAHVGEVEVRVGPEDKILWQVRVEPDADDGWFSGRKDAERAVAGAKLRAAAAGGSWELELDLPHGTDFDDVEEHWLVTVPLRFAVEVDANVGRVAVEGPAGGVDAELNVGELRIEVPQGCVSARANVGEVRIRSATRDLGDVRVAVNIGDVDLLVEDQRIEADRSLSLGGSISMSNGGKDDISARANVGDVRVRIEQEGQP
jgi:hypothetical protein